MCGIAGFTHYARSVDDAVIRRMTESLRHRGPDQQGVFSERHVPSAPCACRSSIWMAASSRYAQKTARTPSSITARSTITWKSARNWSNGVTGSGPPATPKSSLRAFVEWDTDCFRRFRGCSPWPSGRSESERLVLGRDRLGIKPLYIYRDGPDLIFGSELKALLRTPGSRACWTASPSTITFR